MQIPKLADFKNYGKSLIKRCGNLIPREKLDNITNSLYEEMRPLANDTRGEYFITSLACLAGASIAGAYAASSIAKGNPDDARIYGGLTVFNIGVLIMTCAPSPK